MAIESINPATGKRIKEYEEEGAAAIEEKIQRAADTYLQWRETPFSERAGRLLKVASILRERTRELGELVTREMGKPIGQATAEVEKSAAGCEYYAENAQRFLSPRPEPTDGEATRVRYDPIGPVLAIMPWNFPLWQVYRFAAPALMAGNVGLLKHASNVPGCALAVEEIFREAGYPGGAFQTLLISSDPVADIVRDWRVKAATLTGSEPAGRAVAAVAGDSLKKTVLELGGSDAFVVLAGADLDKAAKWAAIARTMNCGQSCIAAKRFIVEEPAVEEFTGRFREQLEAVTIGDPMDEKTGMGPMARGDLRDAIRDQVARTVDAGAKVVYQSDAPEGGGYFTPIVLLAGVKPGMAAFEEETFGPLAPIIAAKDTEEAIALANRTRFGLGGSVWTEDLEKARALAPRIEAGTVAINGMVKSDPRIPFGGVKDSGYGRELSREGIREFVNVKTVWAEK